jgi:hypothetical protein
MDSYQATEKSPKQRMFDSLHGLKEFPTASTADYQPTYYPDGYKGLLPRTQICRVMMFAALLSLVQKLIIHGARSPLSIRLNIHRYGADSISSLNVRGGLKGSNKYI